MIQVRCMVVDDQSQAIDLMTDHIKKIPFLSLAYSTTNSIEALTFLDSESIDCIFLDIEMPQLTGLEFIDMMKAKFGMNMPKIILITGYGQYALSGYEYGVFDYLLKPVSFKRFKLSVDRLVSTFEKIPDARDFFFADIDGQKVRIDFNEIIYIEGAGNYITVTTPEKKITFYKTMGGISEILPPNKFVRVHKSFIVSLVNIQSVKGNEILMKVNNSQKNIPIGVTYKEKLLNTLGIG